MSSAFKNFFITFAICLVVFGFIGFKYVRPWLTNAVDFTDMGNESSAEVSEEVSEDSSPEVSVPVIDVENIDPNGDVFTAVIMAVDSNGRAVDTVFIDSNGKTKQFIYCPIPSTARGTNEVGVTVPVGDLFSTMTLEGVCQSVSTMTGIETKYCLKIKRENLVAIASLIPGASVVLNEDIVLVNPEYKDFQPTESTPYPDDYYITISNVDGKVLLNQKINGKTKLEWLLSYTPNLDGCEYNTLYSSICKSLIRQFFQNEASTKSSSVMAKLLQNCETNLSVESASKHLPTIFSYDDYNRHELNYPSYWETAVAKLRELDGSYN